MYEQTQISLKHKIDEKNVYKISITLNINKT